MGYSKSYFNMGTTTNIHSPTELLTSQQGNSWINYTWLPGPGVTTDSYNVSVNNVWTNGTTQTFNLSNVGPQAGATYLYMHSTVQEGEA